MNLFIGFCFFMVFITILFLIRNQYTLERMNEATYLIHDYCLELIMTGHYNSSYDYFGEMEIDYDKYMFNLSLWGRKSGIKKEYQYLFETK